MPRAVFEPVVPVCERPRDGTQFSINHNSKHITLGRLNHPALLCPSEILFHWPGFQPGPAWGKVSFQLYDSVPSLKVACMLWWLMSCGLFIRPFVSAHWAKPQTRVFWCRHFAVHEKWVITEPSPFRENGPLISTVQATEFHARNMRSLDTTSGVPVEISIEIFETLRPLPNFPEISLPLI